MIEIAPGSSINVGHIIDPNISLQLGKELYESYERLITGFPDEKGGFRYPIKCDAEQYA